MRLPPGLAPLRERNYALYWFGQATSMIGTWIELTTTSWLLYQLTDSAILLGLGGLARGGPVILFAVFGGAVADRVQRHRLLLVTQSLQVVSSLVLGTLVLTGAVRFWHIYLVSVANATIASFDVPARQSLFPTLVPRAQLQNAVTLNSIIFRLSTLIGPAVAGVLIATYSVSLPYFVNAVSYFAIIGALLLMRLPPAVERTRVSIGADALGGIRYALGNRVLPALLIIEACVSVFGSNQALYTIFARDVLLAGATGLGLLLSSIGAGAILGMIALVVVGDIRRKGAFMIGAGLVYAASLIAFAWSRSLPLSMGILFLLGCADSIWGAMRNTIAQLVTSDAYRGRVMSLIVIVSRGVTQFSQLETGAAVSIAGPTAAATFGGAMVVVAVLAAAARAPRLRGFRSGALRPGVPEATAAD